MPLRTLFTILLPLLLLSCGKKEEQSASGQKPEAEPLIKLQTISYYCDTDNINAVISIFSDWERDSFAEIDITPKSGKTRRPDLNIQQSRFLQKEHKLGDITHHLQSRGLLKTPNSWAIFNSTTKRLIIHATERSHWETQRILKNLDAKILATHTFQFYKVQNQNKQPLCTSTSKDLTNAELLASFQQISEQGETCSKNHSCKIIPKLSIKTTTYLSVSDSLISSAQITIEGHIIEKQLLHNFQLTSALFTSRERPVIWKLFSVAETNSSIILKIAANAQFSDGTSVGHWMISEENEKTCFFKNIDYSYSDRFEKISSFQVSPSFFEFRKLDTKLPVSNRFEAYGLDTNDDEWIKYAPSSSTITTNLTGKKRELLKAIVDGTPDSSATNIQTTATRIQSKTKITPEDLTSPTPGFTILDRITNYTRPGAKSQTQITTNDTTLNFIHEPNIGARSHIAELRLELTRKTKTTTDFHYQSQHTLTAGTPKIIPLKSENGLHQSLILQTDITSYDDFP